MLKIVIRTLSVLLIAAGLVLIFQESIKDWYIGRMTNEVVETVTQEKVEKNQMAEADFNFSAVEDLSMETIIEAQYSQDELPVIGAIAIPNVHVRLPILKGVSNENMAVGAGTMKAEQVMGTGNYSLAGHNMQDRSTLFSPLHSITVGTPIYLTDKHQVYEYVVTELMDVDPYRIDVIEDGETSMVTLVTCSFNGERRLIVRGEFVRVYSNEETSDDVLAYFEAE